MLMFLAIVFFPLLILIMGGSQWALKLLIFLLGAMFLIFAGFGAGLSLTLLIEPGSYWRSMTLPGMWTNEWTNSLTLDEPFWKVFAVIYIFAADIWRIYFHILFEHFKISTFIPSVIGWIFAISLFNVMYMKK